MIYRLPHDTQTILLVMLRFTKVNRSRLIPKTIPQK